LRAADADAALPAGIRLAVRLRVRDVEDVTLVDVDAAGPSELLPLLEELAVLVEDLDAVVRAVGHEQPPLRIQGQAVRSVELARAGALLAPGLDERPVLRELHTPPLRVLPLPL